jgi:putative membrane protein
MKAMITLGRIRKRGNRVLINASKSVLQKGLITPMRDIRSARVSAHLPWMLTAAAAVVIGSASMAAPQSDKSSIAAKSSTSASTKLSAGDRQFVKQAAQGGTLEVALGKLAEANGASESVKQFGRQMVTDHTAANKDLERVAKSDGISLDWSPNKSNEATIRKFARLKGAAFDQAYRSAMVTGHTKVAAAFQRETIFGKAPSIRDFASRTLPTIKMHLQMATAMVPGKSKPYAHHTMKPMNSTMKSTTKAQ